MIPTDVVFNILDYLGISQIPINKAHRDYLSKKLEDILKMNPFYEGLRFGNITYDPVYIRNMSYIEKLALVKHIERYERLWPV